MSNAKKSYVRIHSQTPTCLRSAAELFEKGDLLAKSCALFEGILGGAELLSTATSFFGLLIESVNKEACLVIVGGAKLG